VKQHNAYILLLLINYPLIDPFVNAYQMSNTILYFTKKKPPNLCSRITHPESLIFLVNYQSGKEVYSQSIHEDLNLQELNNHIPLTPPPYTTFKPLQQHSWDAVHTPASVV
jgi:hypothetical protein